MASPRHNIALLLSWLSLIVSALAATDSPKPGAAPTESQPLDFLGQKPPGTIPKRFAPEVISLKGAVHGSIAFSPDGSEIYWTLFPPEYRDTPPMIMYVKETDGGWTSPDTAGFCDENGAGEISISPSGDRLYFSSRRPLPQNWGYQLQHGTREWGGRQDLVRGEVR